VAQRVCAIIPAHNEADVISDTVRGALSIPEVSEVVVVDDGSTDNTAKVASASGAGQVLMLSRNLGKGGALNKALPMAKADVILLLDADLGVSAKEAAKLLYPILEGDADMTIAVFKGGSDSKAGSTKLASRSGGFGTVMRTARLGIRVLTIDALRMGYRIMEIPVHMVHRPSGRDVKGFVHRGRQMLDMLGVLGRKVLRR
jgi:glycosyltransferase involved in cell wall biosynthesis